jgi:chorismate--pyruvate lyase
MRLFDWYALDSMTDQLPAVWRYWVQLPGSLTRALQDRSDAFSVQVLAEENLLLDTPLKAFAGQAEQSACWSRQVALCDNKTPWVMAHTLVTQASLAGQLQALTGLNNRPLGELLFTTPGVYKDQLEITRTRDGWGRRARYWLHDCPVLVAEFFMDALLRDEHQRLSPLP